MEATTRLLTPGIPKLMELYQKTFLNFSYIRPEEWAQIQTPNQLMAKQMKVFLENSNTAVEYWNELYSIFNETWADLANSSRKNMEQSFATAEHHKKELDDVAKSTLRSADNVRKKAVEMGHAAIDKTQQGHNNKMERSAKKSMSKNTTKIHAKKD